MDGPIVISKIQKWLDDYKGGDTAVKIESQWHMITIKIIDTAYDHDQKEWEKQKCPFCNQNIDQRKVTFSKNHASALKKWFDYCSANKTNHFTIKDLNLNHSEYANINNLVRFGLAYRQDGKKWWLYFLNMKRASEFFHSKRSVAEYYLDDPTMEEGDPGKRTMSNERIYINDVKSIAEIRDATSWLFTSYYYNEVLQQSIKIEWLFTDNHDVSPWSQTP